MHNSESEMETNGGNGFRCLMIETDNDQLLYYLSARLSLETNRAAERVQEVCAVFN